MVLSCSRDDKDTIPIESWGFADVTAVAGFKYEHGYVGLSPGGDGEREIIAGGVAAGDYDNDGWVDLYVVRGDIGPNLLFRNLGDGRFEEVGQAAGVNLTGMLGSGPIFADYDGDGALDLLVGGINGTPPTLFRNNGDGTFTDATAPSGLANIQNSFSSTFGDYDLDGDLDIFISHWNSNGQEGYLWENDGAGIFMDVSLTAGIQNSLMYDFTSNFADIDNDGDPDLLIAADFGTSQVFLNNGDKTFTNMTTGVISDENGMGAAVGDYDNDGDLDWFVTSIYDPDIAEGFWGITGNRLYRNLGNGTFEDATDEAGVRIGAWGWAACFADFNNDGHLDLFHVNGWDTPTSLAALEFQEDPSRLFISNGDGTFTERSVELGIDDRGQGRGIVCFDYDRDGDIDLFIANNQQPPRLFKNQTGNRLNFLTIRLVGNPPNTEAIGSRIFLTAGGTTQMRELQAGSNFLSQNPVEAHFGLGTIGTVDLIRIEWPSGPATTLADVPANQFLVIQPP